MRKISGRYEVVLRVNSDHSRTSNQSTDKKEESADDDGRSPTTANKMFAVIVKRLY